MGDVRRDRLFDLPDGYVMVDADDARPLVGLSIVDMHGVERVVDIPDRSVARWLCDVFDERARAEYGVTWAYVCRKTRRARRRKRSRLTPAHHDAIRRILNGESDFSGQVSLDLVRWGIATSHLERGVRRLRLVEPDRWRQKYEARDHRGGNERG